MSLTTVFSSFLSSLTHFSIYVKQTALLNVHILFLCLYKIYILIVLKISISTSRIEIEILISNQHYFVPSFHSQDYPKFLTSPICPHCK